MIVAVYLLGLWLGRQRNAITAEDVKKRIHDLVEIPRLVEKTLELDGQIVALARELAHARDFLYLGRGLQYPIALEGALKLKEISYIHAEGYAGGEMKHGPIALIADARSEEHTSELQSRLHLVCRLLLEKKKKIT